ncbi:MAG: 3-oxoacyl-ACP reductase [Deltaproteobacteria bacterium HGW-Deltaproteobacteria-14]|jgi:NAD(P)-dependent dehydrogenase (short-subunit alcohol dehydrogenase family)|nr:MAG: 3-oxoacyl-ACP reductase [Deltaproteobacteria bacterium HGW-Deltaproteobacteria-14]
MERRHVAVVTGANRGLGRAVAKALAERGYRVVGTVRDPATGAAMRDRFAADGLSFDAVAVDVTAPDAGARLAAAVPEGLDVLVNNAAVTFDGFDLGVVDRTLAANWYGAAAVVEALLPALREGGRVVNVSSGMADEASLPAALRAHFHDAAPERAGIDALVSAFRDGVAASGEPPEGWPRSAYRVSKLALNAFTRHVARAVADDPRGLRVNAVCPGWCRTGMGGPAAPRSVAQGTASILWGTEVPVGGPSGGFFRDGRAAQW